MLALPRGVCVTHDPQTNVAYVYLVDRAGGRSKPHRSEYALGQGLVLDLDAEGRLLGIEVLDARRLLRSETLEQAGRTPQRAEDVLAPLDCIVLAACGGDRDAIGLLCRMYRQTLVGDAHDVLGRTRRQDAEDAVQTLWLRMTERTLRFPIIRGAGPVAAADGAVDRAGDRAEGRWAMSAGKGRTAAQMLVDPETTKVIDRVLVAYGVDWQDLGDARQEVYVKALVRFDKGAAPASLDEMHAFCAVIAKRHAIGELRKAAVRGRQLAEGCDPSELAPLFREGRMLREGRMPEKGIDILEGIACRTPYEVIAQEHGISEDLVECRYRRMKSRYRQRLAKLGLLPDMPSLCLVVAQPGAIARLQGAA